MLSSVTFETLPKQKEALKQISVVIVSHWSSSRCTWESMSRSAKTMSLNGESAESRAWSHCDVFGVRGRSWLMSHPTKEKISLFEIIFFAVLTLHLTHRSATKETMKHIQATNGAAASRFSKINSQYIGAQRPSSFVENLNIKQLQFAMKERL